MLKLVSRTPMPDDTWFETWRDGDSVTYRLVTPPDEHLRTRTVSDVLKEWEELEKANAEAWSK